MTGGRSAHDAILAEYQPFHTICGTNLDNELHDLWVPVAAIAANDQKASIDTLWNGEEDAGDEGFTVIGLLEDLDLLSKARTRVQLIDAHCGTWERFGITYVPGFWSVNGVRETSLTLILNAWTQIAGSTERNERAVGFFEVITDGVLRKIIFVWEARFSVSLPTDAIGGAMALAAQPNAPFGPKPVQPSKVSAPNAPASSALLSILT